MAETPKRRTRPSEKLVLTLAAQTGVTPAQMRQIIMQVGLDRASILHEVQKLNGTAEQE